MLVGWLTSKFGDREMAEDLAQDTYLRVWRYAESNDIENVKALLFRTAANLAANEFRSRSRRRKAGLTEQSKDDETDLVASVPSDSPSPESQLLTRTETLSALEAIRGLPEKQRRAFIMSRFEEKSYAEIAGVLGVSVSSIEKYIIAALAHLRASVRGDEASNVVPLNAPGRGRGR
ncbi:sigma-70 family RNA polymerase sigma factor [Parvularcula sp. ZS-1/3]|uniref:Sigma-70 family RNA polymerase sigma factor n=2 Tax=Parvularcula mediterranea TaxID=2732508 RepID=A0A7Y3RKX8_9PROT|nr:sigma-70 family RNA polymerase sigma factor [Parvularcula mediterranea]